MTEQHILITIRTDQEPADLKGDLWYALTHQPAGLELDVVSIEVAP